jgi:glycosyltransferase involved in cell wall biosynthesis
MTLTHLVDGIVTNTETIRQAYMDYGWFDEGFIQVVYNGVREDEDAKPIDFSRDYPGKRIVFSAGRMSEQKGFEDLVEAAALLRKQREDVVFCIAGKGRLKLRLETLVRERGLEDTVFFMGFHEDIHPHLKGCDLFVLSSLYEGMPNVVMEAMAVGKAVVATDVNGVRELMVEGKTGMIVPPKRPDILAETIHGIIDDTDRLDAFGAEGLRRVREHFTMEQMIEALETYFYEKLAETTG